MTEMVPLRDMIQEHHHEVNARFDRLEARLEHSHPDKVSWASFVGTLLPILTGLVGLIFIVAG